VLATGLSLTYGSTVVLDDVTLEVAPGELVVLTGEDGCGTSSLLRLLPGTRLDAPPGDEWDPGEVVPPGLALATHLEGRELWTLSGGERQRVRLSRVLHADVLLLDEGLGALDTAGAQEVLAALRSRAAAGACVLLVAKGDERAYAAADRVLLLDRGCLGPRS